MQRANQDRRNAQGERKLSRKDLMIHARPEDHMLLPTKNMFS